MHSRPELSSPAAGRRADDEPMLRALTLGSDLLQAHRCASLLGDGGFRAEAGSQPGQLDQAVDVVVVAYRSFGKPEQEELRALRAQVNGTPLVVVLGEPVAREIRDAIDAGADSVVLGAEAEQALAASARAACAGQVTVPQLVRDRFGHPCLTPREKQVLALVVMDYPNAAIAVKLHLSLSTVKSHLTSAFSKLGVRSRSEATALIVDPERGHGLGVLAISKSNGHRGD